MSADLSLPMRSGNQVRRSSLARLHLAADDSSTKCGNAVQPEKETYTIVTVNRGAKYHEQPWGFCTGRRKKKAKCSLHGTFGRPRERRQECGSCRETQPPPPPPPGPRNAQAAAAGSASPGAYFHHLQLVLQGKGLPPHVKKYRKLQLVCTRESCNQFTMHSIFLSL